MKKQVCYWKLADRLKRMGLFIWYTDKTGRTGFTRRKDYIQWAKSIGHIKTHWLGGHTA